MSLTNINNVFRTQKVASTGMRVARRWMDIISNNIANVNTLDTGKIDKDGNFIPYKREVPVLAKVSSENFRDNKVNGDVLNGVKIAGIVKVEDNIKKVFDPNHPAARKNGTPDAGYVYYPGVSVGQEMADLKIAAATYEANLTVVSKANLMIKQALSIGRRS